MAEKQCSNGQNHYDNPDAFLLQGSLIMSGAGRAVVLAVGERTVREQEVTVSELRTDDEETAMQKKLKDLGDLISKYAKYAAILMFFIMSVYLIIAILFS